MIQDILPHLWFDKEATESAAFYVSLFSNSKVTNITTIHDTPSGDCDIVSFQLAGQPFMAISAGPYFKLNPSVSFLIACETKAEVDKFWNALSDKGAVLMELGSYPFSERYGWAQDKYGLSWQVMFMGDRKIKQKITPTLMFVGDQCGKADEAINFYASLLPRSKVGEVMRYGKNQAPDKEGTVVHAGFTLLDREFAAMDSAHNHKFAFNEAISFIVKCETQQDIDDIWSKLSAVPQAEQCGWVKDKFGFSWQITPVIMDQLMRDKSKVDKVTQAFLKMKKFNIAELEKAAS